MSYRTARIYKCAICGAEAEAEDLSSPFWPLDKYLTLPIGWLGEDKKHGLCICKSCRNGIKNVTACLEKCNEETA